MNKLAEHIFCALDGFDQISKNTTGRQEIAFNSLFRYVNDPAFSPDDAFKVALQNDLRLRRDLNLLIRKNALQVMDHAIAASTGLIEQRESDGFALSLKPSQANPDQIYLIIESMEREESPKFLFVMEKEGATHRQEIEDFEDGSAQILLSIEDDIVKALHNYQSDVILR